MKEIEISQNDESTLRRLFGESRAEWAQESFRDLFVPPTYISKLESFRPTFLIGGRGTGKTTALQSLGFSETYQRLVEEGLSFSDQEYLGVLVRINKNRAHAFKNDAVPSDKWNRAFAHYFNLIVCQELVKLTSWLIDNIEVSVSTESIRRIALDLCVSESNNLEELKNAIKIAISELQKYVNNPTHSKDISFSFPESPVRVFAEVLEESDALGGRAIFCCIDEYENLLDYQQGIINTYIKHAMAPLSYKIGVRMYGLRNKSTSDDNDLLRPPDDYAQIDISEEGFEYFATEVANKRLFYAKHKKNLKLPDSIDKFLMDMSIPDEAEKLGVERISKEVLHELYEQNEETAKYFQKKKPSETYFLKYWQEKEGGQLIHLAKDWMKNEKQWKTRLGNHGYASLFWINKGRKGIRIKKYYSGLKTILALSGGNIRYFLELIDASIYFELKNNENKVKNCLLISPESQTYALKEVGKKRIDQLEGLSDKGMRLKRLVLGIGKVFFELARTPANRAPEVVSFVVTGQAYEVDKISKLLNDGVGHLAFEAYTRTKPTNNLEIKDNEYRLHRIFSGFFEISYRKKRRTIFNARDLIEIVEGKPSEAINSLLKEENIKVEEELPEQLAFFSQFYDDHS